MTEESLLKLQAKVSKENLWNYYRLHNITDTAKHFKISQTYVGALIKSYNLIKSKDDIKATKEQTCLEKYGVKNVFQLPENIKSGDKNPSKRPEVIAKIQATRNANNSYETAVIRGRETRIKNSGSIEASYKIGMLKQQQTLIDKFGSLEAAYDFQKASREATFISKYGVDNPFKALEIREKIKQTNLTRYGVNYPGQSKQLMAIAKNTVVDRYGIDNINNWRKGQLTRVRNFGSVKKSYKVAAVKRDATMLAKYGVTCLFNSPDIASHRHKKCTGPNNKFKSLLEYNKLDYIQEFVLGNKSFDFKINNILVEINPTITHNSTFGIYGDKKGLPTDYHSLKSKLARDNNYRCIQVWDWDDKNKIISLLQPKPRLYARQCEVREISKKEASDFLNIYHLQGYAKDSIRIGLFFDNTLVSVMTFGKPRYNKKFDYELIRYASSHNICGGAEKLFNYFKKNFEFKSIISYCDYSKFNGDTYIKLGFNYEGCTISKHWFNMRTNTHITDNFLRQRGFDQLFGKIYGEYGKGTSNSDLMLKHGFVEIYDSGQARYTLYKDI